MTMLIGNIKLENAPTFMKNSELAKLSTGQRKSGNENAKKLLGKIINKAN